MEGGEEEATQREVDDYLAALPRKLHLRPAQYRARFHRPKGEIEVGDDWFKEGAQKRVGRIQLSIGQLQAQGEKLRKKVVKVNKPNGKGRLGVIMNDHQNDQPGGGVELSRSSSASSYSGSTTGTTTDTGLEGISRIDSTISRSMTEDSMLGNMDNKRSNLAQRLLLKGSKELKSLVKRKKGRGLDEDEIIVRALMELGAVVEEKEETVVEVMYEHQRGALLLGLPRFSANLLTQADPSHFSNARLRDSSFTPSTYPLPTPFWRWSTTWMIDMGGDVDEEGWEYAYRFRSTGGWSGTPGAFAFVRRRRFIRKRVYQPKQLIKDQEDPPAIVRPSQINWEGLRNSDFADRPTPPDGSRIEEDINNDVVGIRDATSILPLSSASKEDIFTWSAELAIDNPFLAWKFIQDNGERVLEKRRERDAKGSRSEEELFGIWRDAVVTINFRGISRVLRHFKLDRQRLRVFRWWLGQAEFPEVEELELKNQPALDDVWPLIEMRLDSILRLFEFQESRLELLRLILSLHPIQDSHHKYTSYDRGQPDQPSVLSPGGSGRIQFYSDLVELEKQFAGRAIAGKSVAVSQA